jgi:sulfide dehydrogenase cytochrome subunit
VTWPRILTFVLCATAPLAGNCADDAAARNLAATCASCHGTEGHSVARDIPSLAGVSKEKIASDMKAFRSGGRPATVMHQIARGYTGAQVDVIAAYFAARKPR